MCLYIISLNEFNKVNGISSCNKEEPGRGNKSTTSNTFQ